MCLAVPGEILAIEGDDPMTRTAKISFWGAIKQASLALVPEAKPGDYVLVHAGFAITVLDRQSGQQTLEAINRLEDEASEAQVRK